MQFMNYKRLSDIVANNKPFRGTDNEYPLAKRAHSYKRFLVEKDIEGNVEYRIKYGDIYEDVIITQAEYDLMEKEARYEQREIKQADGTSKYIKWVRKDHIIGVVRKDNTFEFTANLMHQGSRGFISNALGQGEVSSSVKHGGTIYREAEYQWDSGVRNRETIKIIPLFKGQRINLDNITSLVDYEVHAPFINRAKSKGVMADYVDALKFNEVMFKTMTPEVLRSGLQEVFKEVHKGAPENNGKWRNAHSLNMLEEYATASLNIDMYNTVLALMMVHDYPAWYMGAEDTYHLSRELNPFILYTSTRKKIERHLKVENDVLDVKVYKANEVYPSNNWDIKVMVNGTQVNTY